MARASFRLTPDLASRLAVGYGGKRGRWKRVPHWEIAPYPAGNVYASVADMAQFAAAILGRGGNATGRVLGEETFALMTVPQGDADPRHPRMGVGLWLQQEARLDVMGHDGGWAGFVSSLLAAPDAGVAALAFTNSGHEVPHGIAAETLRALTGRPDPAAHVLGTHPQRRRAHRRRRRALRVCGPARYGHVRRTGAGPGRPRRGAGHRLRTASARPGPVAPRGDGARGHCRGGHGDRCGDPVASRALMCGGDEGVPPAATRL